MSARFNRRSAMPTSLRTSEAPGSRTHHMCATGPAEGVAHRSPRRAPLRRRGSTFDLLCIVIFEPTSQHQNLMKFRPADANTKQHSGQHTNTHTSLYSDNGANIWPNVSRHVRTQSRFHAARSVPILINLIDATHRRTGTMPRSSGGRGIGVVDTVIARRHRTQ